MRGENGVTIVNLLAFVLKADSYFWHYNVKVTTLIDQGNIALIISGFRLHHTVHLYLFTDVLNFFVCSNLH